MNMATKQVIFEEKLKEYVKASKEEKGRILNAVCSVTGARRKSAIRRFRSLQLKDKSIPDKRGRPRTYTNTVTAALKEVWDTAHQICGERLQPMIPEYVTVLKRDRMWSYDDETTSALVRMSVSTVKRRVGKMEKEGGRKGRSLTKPSILKEIIPIRRGPWEDPRPGKGEVDTVAHCGHTLWGDFVYTVQYTDVATIWTCLSAQWNKSEQATIASIERIKGRLPFPLLAIDPDSGSEFINWLLKGWCDDKMVVMTRTRPYMKNDHARIEQKNYTNVREFVGYGRFDHPDAVTLLNQLYDMLEDYINFFLPSQKCIKKERIGSRYKRTHDQAQTAYQRVLAEPRIDPKVKENLSRKYATLNPRILKQKSDRLIQKLIKNQWSPTRKLR
jgi:hypothetical protein